MSSNLKKYIGLDVHKEAIAIAVLNDAGKLVMESIIETKAATLLEFLHGLRGELHVTLEEGTWAAWLYDVLKPHVEKIVVCNPRRNALLKEGSKSDKLDARKLAELLSAVYHGENGLRTLRELARSYLTVSKDQGRVMSRLKALYRSRGIPCSGTQVYAPRHREQWVSKIAQPGVRRRAELFYQQLDGLSVVRHTVRGELFEPPGSRSQRLVAPRPLLPGYRPPAYSRAVDTYKLPGCLVNQRTLLSGRQCGTGGQGSLHSARHAILRPESN
jgi:hypothetical protein